MMIVQNTLFQYYTSVLSRMITKNCTNKENHNVATKVRKEMQEQIIESAGQIYNYLADKGEVTINKMTKDLDLEDNFVSMGLGWLSREDKISYTRKPKSISVRLV